MSAWTSIVEDDAKRLVTFSIKPTYPATGYGYVERGDPIAGFDDAFRAKRFVDVARFQRSRLVGTLRPHTGVAISLQFHADLQRIALGLRRALLCAADLIGNSSDRLDVMADLVRHHIGLRCVARYLARDLPAPTAPFLVDTDAGPRRCQVHGEQVEVDMGPALALGAPTVAGRHFAAYSLGNPHAVAFVGADEDPEQLARTLVPRPRTFAGKISEMALAIRIEMSLSKREIFEEYLSRIPFGPTVRGVEAASRGLFDRPARELSLAEAALLDREVLGLALDIVDAFLSAQFEGGRHATRVDMIVVLEQ